MEGPVPEVDFSPFSLEMPMPFEGPFHANERQQEVGKEIYEILIRHGFVYAFGLLSSAEVAEVFRGSKTFFAETDRSTLPRLTPHSNVGYGGPGNEALNARRAADLKEVFNVRKETLTDGTLTFHDSFPGYCEKVWDLCARAAQRALLAFGTALQLDDPAAFVRPLSKWDLCTLRLLHYPGDGPNSSDTSALPCGEHTDFGSVTVLLLEDGVEGLEVRSPSGGWISAPGKEGAVLLNTGALLARWCNDHVKATPHRVVATHRERYSIAFFCDPDKDTLVEALPEFTKEKPAKYGPIRAEEYLRQCLTGAMHGDLTEEAKKSLEI